jgi:hypothetical protein
MMFLLLTGNFQHGEDYRVLHQEIIDGDMLFFPVDAAEYDEDDDNQETNTGKGCSQVMSEAE